MSWTELMGKGTRLSNWLLCCTLLTISFLPSLQADGDEKLATLVCDDQINLALNGYCEGEVTVEMILEGESTIPDFSPLNYDVIIEGPNGLLSGMTVTEIGLYTVTVSENGTGPAGMTPPFNSCWGHILVEDKLPPQLVSCPCEVGNTDPDCVLPILCEDLGDIGGLMVEQPVATDNCNNDFDITFTDEIDGEDCITTVVTRTWRLTDSDGNYVTCQSEYRIDPLALTAAIQTPKQNVDLECGAGISPEEIYDFFADQYREDNPCGTAYVSCDPNDLDYDAAYAAAYEEDVHQYALMFSFPSINGIKLIGNICNTVTSYDDTVIPICSSEPGCEGNAKVIRKWAIYDWCDPFLEPIRFNQIIKASDNTVPEIEAGSFTASVDPWGCTARVIFPEPTHLSDNCSSYVNYTVTGSGSSASYPILFDPVLGYYSNSLPVGEHTFYYNAFDCCDNTTSEGVIVTVKDATPPVAITKQDIVVSLIPNQGGIIEPGLTKIFAENVDNGSFDGCGPVKLEIRREFAMCGDSSSVTYNNDGHDYDDPDDYDDGRFVKFCCNDLIEYGTDEDGDGINDYAQIKVWLRVWDDGDGDGYFGSYGDNYSEVWSYVRLEDKSRPTIQCPPDVVIDCDSNSADLSNTGEAVAYGSCGSAAVTYEDLGDLSSCNEGIITRRWSVVGYPNIYCDQIITLSGALIGGPITVEFPSDTIITCEDDLDQHPTWTAGTCDMMAYSVERDTFYFSDGACFKVLNYWTVINWCTYEPANPNTEGIWNKVQVVKIIDETAPVITGCVDETFDAGVACINDNIMLTNTAEDVGLCSSDRLVWIVQVDLNSDFSIDYTFSSTAPQNSGFYIPPSNSGGEIKITLPEGVAGSMTSHLVTWRVSDGCGNYTSCTSTFMVVDNIPPTPYCVNLSTALMENGQVELWACDFDLGAFDNCSDNKDLRFTFTDVNPDDDPAYNPLTNCSSRLFTCDDLIASGGLPLTLDVYVSDEKDYSVFCSVFLTLVDNNDSCEDVGNNPSAQIGGQIITENGETLEQVDVTLSSNQPEYPITNRTDNTGHFNFPKNKLAKNYQIDSYDNSNPLNGVSTLDLVLIQRHILGLKKFETPFKLIAGDINNDDAITSLDLLELRKLILGIYDEYPNNKSWKFINEARILDASNPWPLFETRYIENLSNNQMHEDFVGVKIGDVNNTADVNAKSNSDVQSRSSKSLTLNYDNKEFAKGEVVNMALRLDEITNLSGMQFTLETSNLELISIDGNGLKVTEENFAVLNDNTITFSWHSSEMLNEFELFTLSFRAKENGTLNESVNISSQVTQSEAYLGKDFEIVPVNLFGRNNSEQTFTLYQNNPNPFNGSTNISFVLPESTSVTLSVIDVTGRIVWSSVNDYEKGYNSIDITSKEIATTGILYYKLEAGSLSATKKMIIIK
ncbi:MAG: T9SS type A sorting domain-containing protein [Saprospiraceae bacterium]|nr:T9SS type A sorting domain-containing protein [Saprospiraceae bacterium]